MCWGETWFRNIEGNRESIQDAVDQTGAFSKIPFHECAEAWKPFFWKPDVWLCFVFHVTRFVRFFIVRYLNSISMQFVAW